MIFAPSIKQSDIYCIYIMSIYALEQVKIQGPSIIYLCFDICSQYNNCSSSHNLMLVDTLAYLQHDAVESKVQYGEWFSFLFSPSVKIIIFCSRLIFKF